MQCPEKDHENTFTNKVQLGKGSPNGNASEESWGKGKERKEIKVNWKNRTAAKAEKWKISLAKKKTKR